jgi:hypothetical protein
MSADWQHHIVTVEIGSAYTQMSLSDPPDERDVHVKFACSAPEDGSCRNYPPVAVGPTWEGCTCDVWFICDDHFPSDEGGCGLDDDAPAHDNAGHLFAPGQECWVQGWFDGAGHQYVGPDADDRTDNCVPGVARTGEIDVSFDGEFVEWQWHFPQRMGVPS